MKFELPTFWCFAAVMKTMRNNFINIELHQELQLLKDTVGYLDPPLHRHMSACADPDADWLFCHRWLLLNFRREFDLDAIVPLWERMWAQHSTSHFNIVIAVGILEMHRDQILAIRSPDELLGFLQHLAEGLDVHVVIARAQEGTSCWPSPVSSCRFVHSNCAERCVLTVPLVQPWHVSHLHPARRSPHQSSPW